MRKSRIDGYKVKLKKEVPVVIERPYSFWRDVIIKNKYVPMSIVLSAVFVIYAVLKLGIADNIEAVDNFSYEQVRFIYICFIFIMSILLSSAIIGAISFLFSGRISSISLISLPIYIAIGMYMGWFKFIRDLIRLPFCLIMWISTKVSDKQYDKHKVIEQYHEYL